MEKRTLIVIGSAALVACLAYPVWSSASTRIKSAALADAYPLEVERARNLGVKVDLDSLLADVPRLSSKDASAVVGLLSDGIGPNAHSRQNLVPMSSSLGVDLHAYLEKQKKLVDLAREVGQKSTFAVWRMKVGEEDVADYRVPTSMTTGLLLLGLSATDHSRRGEDAACITDLRAMASTCRLQTDCASLSTYNSRLNSMTLLLENLRLIAVSRQSDAEFLRRLRTEVIDDLQTPDPRPAVRNEAYFALYRAKTVLTNPSPVMATLGIRPQHAEAWRDPVVQKSAKTLILRAYNDLAERFDHAWPSWEQVVAVLRTPDDVDLGERGSRRAEQAVARFFLPAFTGAVSAAQNIEARRVITGAWLATLEATAREGRTPEHLSTTYMDPYDSKPLRYLKKPGGFIVYSVGANKRDDGGFTHIKRASDTSDLGIDTVARPIGNIEGY